MAQNKSLNKFLILGANKFIGYDLIRALNIKYGSRTVIATDSVE
jgi:dTDP-D-glucose 4,6-dehydratase